jgi:ParB/RepB/Spo0J family partition protein
MEMRLKEMAESTRDLFLMSLDKIKPGQNIREDFSTVPALANLMVLQGQLRPIEIRWNNDFAVIVDGERRYRAVLHANEHLDAKILTMQCVGEQQGISPEMRIVRQLIGDDGVQPFTVIEKAKAFKKLVEAKWTLASIAESVGKSAQYIADQLALIEAPQELREAVEKGTMSPTAATKAARATPEKREKAIAKAKEGKKVKVKDVEGGGPMGIGDLHKAIKRADNYVYESKKNTVEEARWQGVKFGLELAAGMHDREF